MAAMTPQIIMLGIGLLGGSGSALFLTRGRSQQGVLTQRLASLAERRPGAGGAPAGRTGWNVLETILTTGASDRREAAELLHAAGYFDPARVAWYAIARAAGSVLAGCAMALGMAMAGKSGPALAWYAAGGAAAAFLVAKIVLRSMGASGTRRLNREMPFLLDMLLLLLESGISLDQCFRYIVQGHIGGMERMQRVMAALVDDLQKGMGYEQALDRWADRLAVSGARDLAGLFKQTLLYGTEIGPTLREFVREFSDRRLATARSSVGRQAALMTVVLIVCMMPAVMIMLAGPATVAVKSAVHSIAQNARNLPSSKSPGTLISGKSK